MKYTDADVELTVAAVAAAHDADPFATDLSVARSVLDAFADAGRLASDGARHAAERLLRMEREHTGSGREGHLSEADLRPLLHALGVGTGQQP